MYAGGNMYVNSAGATFLQFRQNGGDVGLVQWTGASMELKVTSGAVHYLSVHNNGIIYGATGYCCRQGMNGGFLNQRFNIWWDGTPELFIDASYVGDFVMSSDYRIKRDINPLPSTWDQVKALKPISYYRKDYGERRDINGKIERDKNGKAIPFMPKKTDAVQWGFVAHELQETLITAAATGVKDQENCIQSPNPIVVLAALTRTVQELQARVEAMEAR